MGLMDKVMGMLKGNKEMVSDGMDKAGDMVDEKTDGKYTDQIDTAKDKVTDMIEDEG